MFGCGRKCGLFAESVSGSVVMGAHLQQLSAFPYLLALVPSVPTSPRPAPVSTPAAFPIFPISHPISLSILMPSPSSFPRVAPLPTRLLWPVSRSTPVSPPLLRPRSVFSVVASVVPVSIISLFSDNSGAICSLRLVAAIYWAGVITLPHGRAISALCTFGRWFCHCK